MMKHILKAKTLLCPFLRRACGLPVLSRLCRTGRRRLLPCYDYTRFKDAQTYTSPTTGANTFSNGTDGSMDVVKEFENLTGIRTIHTTYDTNESLYAAEKAAAITTSSSQRLYIGKMAAEGMLRELGPRQYPQRGAHRRGIPLKPFDR